MSDLTPQSQNISTKDSPLSSATHLSSLNFSIFTQKYYELRHNKPNNHKGLVRKQWLKITRNYLKVERNNILYNYFNAQKIHNSRKEILQKNILSKWHERYLERINKQESINDKEETKDLNQITERGLNSFETNENNIENTTPASPSSPRSKKIIHKQYSDKSTDVIEIPKPSFAERIKSINCKTIILSLFIAFIACAGTYIGFHFYFEHNKFHQLYKKHKYESTLPPHDQDSDGETIIDYNKVFPEDQDDLNHIVKNLIKKVKNIKNSQNEMNQQVQHIEESLDDEQVDKKVDIQDLSNPNSDTATSTEVNETHQKTNDTNSSTELESNENNSSTNANTEPTK